MPRCRGTSRVSSRCRLSRHKPSVQGSIVYTDNKVERQEWATRTKRNCESGWRTSTFRFWPVGLAASPPYCMMRLLDSCAREYSFRRIYICKGRVKNLRYTDDDTKLLILPVGACMSSLKVFPLILLPSILLPVSLHI